MIASADSVSLTRTLTQSDFDRFAALSGDDNPIHVDAGFSARTRFGRTVAHGLMLSTILHGLADRLVPGGRQVEGSLKFPAATFADEPLRFSASVTEHAGQRWVVDLCCARINDGTVTCEGRTTLMASEP